MKTEPTTLYRAFGQTGDLLYIGIARSWPRRWTQHADRSPWFKDVREVHIERFGDRPAALVAEAQAIKAECPKHNIKHNRSSVTRQPSQQHKGGDIGMRPLQFGVHGEGRNDDTSYGDRYWAIGLPDGREVFLLADEVQVLPTGALQCIGAFRNRRQPDDVREPQTLLVLPTGAWTHAYAASLLDGCPVAIDHLASPED